MQDALGPPSGHKEAPAGTSSLKPVIRGSAGSCLLVRGLLEEGGQGSPGPRISIYKDCRAGRSLMPRKLRGIYGRSPGLGEQVEPVCCQAGLQVYHRALSVIWEGTRQICLPPSKVCGLCCISWRQPGRRPTQSLSSAPAALVYPKSLGVWASWLLVYRVASRWQQ